MTEECLICGAPLEYLNQDQLMECAICHKQELSKTRCVNGHYVCSDCHTQGMDQIFGVCLAERSTDPIAIVQRMMNLPFCHMHGPEHHVMVGAALLTAYKNAGGALDLEQALREIYFRGFETAVKASRPMAVMSSYNMINGIHAANSVDLLTTVLRGEWGFDGIVMTDWGTTAEAKPDLEGRLPVYGWSSAAGCIKAGNDLIMPGSQKDVEEILSRHRVVNLKGIVDLDAASHRTELGPHLLGVDPYRQRAVGRVVHGQVPPSLFKDHLGVDLPHPQQGDPLRLDLESGEGTLQSGQLTLLVAEGIAVLAVGGQPALGHQLNDLRLLVLKGLPALNGYDNIVLHGSMFPLYRHFRSQIAPYYIQFRPQCKGLVFNSS